MISIIDPQSALPNCKNSPTPRRSITNPSGSTFYTPGVDFHANRFSDLAFRLTGLLKDLSPPRRNWEVLIPKKVLNSRAKEAELENPRCMAMAVIVILGLLMSFIAAVSARVRRMKVLRVSPVIPRKTR